MRPIIDSSVTVAWMLEDEATAAVLAVRATVEAAGALVPTLWHLEVANALLVAERRGRFDRGFRQRRLQDLARLEIAVDGATAAEAWHSTLHLADRHGLTAYDAAYLELALRAGLPLATLDGELRTAARRSGVEVLPA